MYNKNNKAFSVIELSIAFLIIATIILAIIKSSAVIEKVKINSAARLTESSYVKSVEGLSLWLETTSKQSFDTQLNDGDEVLKWNSLKGFKGGVMQNAEVASGVAGALPPTYQKNALNGLPMVKLGDGQCLSVPSSFDGGSVDLTVFLILSVEQLPAYPDRLPIFAKSSGSNPLPYEIRYRFNSNGNTLYDLYSNGLLFTNYDYGPISKPHLFTLKYKGSQKGFTSYFNGVIKYNHNTFGVNNLTNNSSDLYIGCLGNGYGINNKTISVGEVIAFSRVLKSDEIDSINQFLLKKWGIE